uniref:Membrane-anchored protein n=1 Tax=Caulobacter sp. (strain K31) TaxID=366602 RepID=B0SZN3_CAUSK
MNERQVDQISKVPAVTLGFWILKILATTLGETGGDTVSMTLNLGYLVSSAIFLAAMVVLVIWQITAKRFHPFLYWATIIASTTAGTTMADFATRSLGVGYTGGAVLLAAAVLACLAAWRLSLGAISADAIVTPKAEAFYWATITLSQTLGTALGDWTADTGGLGYVGAALGFGVLLAIVAALYFRTRLNRVLLFWAAFILTRPLGATIGDFLDKPHEHGGLAFSRPLASAVLAGAILALVILLPQRAGRHPGGRDDGAAPVT